MPRGFLSFGSWQAGHFAYLSMCVIIKRERRKKKKGATGLSMQRLFPRASIEPLCFFDVFFFFFNQIKIYRLSLRKWRRDTVAIETASKLGANIRASTYKKCASVRTIGGPQCTITLTLESVAAYLTSCSLTLPEALIRCRLLLLRAAT